MTVHFPSRLIFFTRSLSSVEVRGRVCFARVVQRSVIGGSQGSIKSNSVRRTTDTDAKRSREFQSIVMQDTKSLQEFMELVGRLKHMKRMGWVKRNIPDPETIAGHMYRMAMLSFLVDGKENLDKTKIMQMTLIHDLAECIVGDITPHCGIPPDEKHRMEDEAMENICKLLGDKGPEILQIFREYEKQESPEALYVKDLDRLDLLMQAYEYEKRDNIPGELDEFFVAINGKIRHPFINKIAVDINEERDKFCRNINISK